MLIRFIIILFVVTVIVVQFVTRKSSSGFDEKMAEYAKKLKEAENNFVRGEIDLPFVSPDTSSLPLDEYPDLPEYKKLIRKQNLCVC